MNKNIFIIKNFFKKINNFFINNNRRNVKGKKWVQIHTDIFKFHSVMKKFALHSMHTHWFLVLHLWNTLRCTISICIWLELILKTILRLIKLILKRVNDGISFIAKAFRSINRSIHHRVEQLMSKLIIPHINKFYR